MLRDQHASQTEGEVKAKVADRIEPVVLEVDDAALERDSKKQEDKDDGNIISGKAPRRESSNVEKTLKAIVRDC